jgi:hypothetical protein
MRLLWVICPDCAHANYWDANAHDVIAVTLLCKCGANFNVHFKSKRFLDSLTDEPGKVSAIDGRQSE